MYGQKRADGTEFRHFVFHFRPSTSIIVPRCAPSCRAIQVPMGLSDGTCTIVVMRVCRVSFTTTFTLILFSLCRFLYISTSPLSCLVPSLVFGCLQTAPGGSHNIQSAFHCLLPFPLRLHLCRLNVMSALPATGDASELLTRIKQLGRGVVPIHEKASPFSCLF